MSFAHAHPQSDPLRLTLHRPIPDCLVAEVAGELDLATAPRLHATLSETLDKGALTELVVDLTKVQFLAVAGIRALLDIRAQAQRRRVALRLVAGQRAVLRPMALLGLAELFDLRTTFHHRSTDAVDGERGEEADRGDEPGE